MNFNNKVLVLTTILLSLCHHFATAQKNNVWYFGNKAGISFTGGVVTTLNNGALTSDEGVASICDNNGTILFYTNGVTVYNKNHAIMSGGNGLSGHISSTQSAIIVPQPSSDSKYYIFTNSGGPVNGTILQVSYYIVDMNAVAGLGAVTTGPMSLLTDSTTEKLTAVLHSNGRDYWVITASQGNTHSNFLAYLVNTAGVSAPVVSSRGKTGDMQMGYLKASPDGKKIATANMGGSCEIFDFDPATGVVSNPQIFCLHKGYGVEFSPDGTKLYLSGFHTDQVSQFDLTIANIPASEVTLTALNPAYNYAYHGALQLGPDNKIYVSRLPNAFLDIIENPNSPGASCNYNASGILLSSGTRCNSGLPNFVNTYSYPLSVELGDDTIICAGEYLELNIKATPYVGIFWSNGDTLEKTTVKSPGWHWVMVCNAIDTAYDSIYITIYKKFKVYLGADTAFCGAFSHLLDAGKGALNYDWSTGDTTVNILVKQPGMYAVTIKDSNSCPAGDTTLIDQLLMPFASINPNADCKSVNVAVNHRQKDVEYYWSTGDTGLHVRISKMGIYTLTAKNKFCSLTYTIKVDQLPLSTISLGPDITVCEENSVNLNCTQGKSFLWSTGEVSSTITVHKDGAYWVTASENNCSATDTIVVLMDCGFTSFIPNAFTPNEDNRNELFKVEGDHIQKVDMQIYNRWGQLLFAGSGKDTGWDGNYKDKPCQQDIYIYMIIVTGNHQGKMIKKEFAGSLILLR
jgi:gliding motility-associated-like protein